MFYARMCMVSMIKIGGMLLGIRLMKVVPIFCLQETKRESFDIHYIRKFAPKRFDKFDYCPSLGASGGILVC